MNVTENGNEPRPATLLGAMTSPALERAWDGCLAEWKGASGEEVVTARMAVLMLRDHLLRPVRAVDSPDDERAAAFLCLLHLHAYWRLLHLQMQAEAGGGKDGEIGRPSPHLAYRAALAAILLDAVEDFLPPADRERAARLLSHGLAAVPGCA